DSFGEIDKHAFIEGVIDGRWVSEIRNQCVLPTFAGINWAQFNKIDCYLDASKTAARNEDAQEEDVTVKGLKKHKR
ncbi:unnamed protein product, partial [Oikopleura dioica]